MNLTLANKATQAVTAKGYVTTPHECEKWVREVVQSVYAAKFDKFWAGSALLTALNFQADGKYIIRLEAGTQIGDLLYKMTGSAGAGHVGIRVQGNRVAENASVHWNSEVAHPDARGFRSLKEFGHYDLIVRLR